MKISVSGIRGIFGKDLTLYDILKFSNNFSTLIKSKKCVIAKDTRPSSSIITETAKASLMQCGIDVYDLGMSPTPVAFRESRKYGAGLIITSSHNPIEWNGLKLIIDGKGLNEEQMSLINTEQITNKSKIGTEHNIKSDYTNEAAKVIGDVSDSPKVTVDVGGGAAKTVSPKLLEIIGCDVKTINNDLEKNSRGSDPTTDPLNELISNNEERDLGFAFDLDGDRLVIVRNGQKQTPDVTLGLGVAKALELGHKNFVLSLDTSVSIENYIKQNAKNAYIIYMNGIESALNSNKNPYIVGEQLTLADICFFCEYALFSREQIKPITQKEEEWNSILNALNKDNFTKAISHYNKLSQIPAFAEDSVEYLKKIDTAISN